jgi:RNA polymerase sigma-70 factor (ECF subfamily)
MTEAEELELARQDHRHFGVVYERYFEQIYRFIFKRLGGDEAVAGDLAQQTFMKAMANLSKYEDRGLPFSAWLYRIAQNEVNMFFRAQKSTISSRSTTAN